MMMLELLGEFLMAVSLNQLLLTGMAKILQLQPISCTLMTIFDGEAPTDVIPTDYKRAVVSVTWEGLFTSGTPVRQWTDIAPRGLETISNAGNSFNFSV